MAVGAGAGAGAGAGGGAGVGAGANTGANAGAAGASSQHPAGESTAGNTHKKDGVVDAEFESNN